MPSALAGTIGLMIARSAIAQKRRSSPNPMRLPKRKPALTLKCAAKLTIGIRIGSPFAPRSASKVGPLSEGLTMCPFT
jgi:hypothetical protein